jgi:hypothetical protein
VTAPARAIITVRVMTNILCPLFSVWETGPEQPGPVAF